MARLLVDTSLRMSIMPVFCPEFRLISREYCPVVLSGLYHRQIELEGPIVIVGMVKTCLPAFVLLNPFVCANDAAVFRPPILLGTAVTALVLTRVPVTPDASARKAVEWNG
jgi:hypothetical protein